MTVKVQQETTITLPIEEYNALIEEIEILQDTIDALKAKAEIAAEGTTPKTWDTFLKELDDDGLLD